jgi:septum formation protein
MARMIYLASASPRRQELLRQVGVPFEALPSGIEEEHGPNETPADYVRRVALEKARAVTDTIRARGRPLHPVLGADTEVVLGTEVLGKPRDREHGLAILRRLAGRTHEVLTGLALLHRGLEFTALSSSRVSFGPISEDELSEYWETGEPADKAGAYAVQGRAAVFITNIDGSYSGIMGLPLHEFWLLLRRVDRDGR